MSALAFHGVTFNVQSINNTVYITSTQLSHALNFKRDDAVQKIYIRNQDEFSPGMSLLPQIGGTRLFSLRGAHLVAMLARTPIAKEFRKWVLDVLDKGTQQPELDFTDIDAMKSAREIAFKYFDDLRDAVKAGRHSAPMDDIPSDVLAGMVSAALRQRQFVLSFDHKGELCIRPMPDPYEGLAPAIADPSNIGLEDQVISEIGHACMTALAWRAKSRKAVIGRARSGDASQR